MGIMDTIETPQDRPVVVTICGDSGMGKTSLAALFPKPIFIRAEDGLQAIPSSLRPSAFPVIGSTDDLWDQLKALIHQPHDYQTCVIDSVTKLERIFCDEVLADAQKVSSGVKSLNQAFGGYGAGPNMVAAMHQRVRKAAALMTERRGMHVVFLAHVDTETMKLPDREDFMRYKLKMHEKSSAVYIDDVDVVGFIRLETRLKGEDGDRKKAFSNGDRELICHAVASNVSKNRYAINDTLPLPIGVNPLADFIPALKANMTVPVTPKPDAKTDTKQNAEKIDDKESEAAE